MFATQAPFEELDAITAGDFLETAFGQTTGLLEAHRPRCELIGVTVTWESIGPRQALRRYRQVCDPRRFGNGSPRRPWVLRDN
jgi:hypothetical protein